MPTKTMLFIAAAFFAAVTGAQPHTNGVALAYFAPENQLFYRLRTGEGGYREFQRDLNDLTLMRGVNGWYARIGKEGVVTVAGPVRGGVERYVFDRGCVISHLAPGVTNSFSMADARVPSEEASAPYLFGSIQERLEHSHVAAKAPRTAKEILKGKWKRSGRLAWPFENPNECGFLYASLALLALYLTCFRRRALTIAGLALCAAFVVPLLLTASRGSFLAFATGLVPVVIVRFRELVRSRWTYIVIGVIVIAAIAWFSIKGFGIITRGSSGKSSWSNEVRLEMWGMAPRMMVDAPSGWHANAGKAYLDWYEDFDCFTAPGSLINDHLSIMVRLGWTARFIYVFCWFLALFGLFFQGLKTKDQTATGVLAAFAVACWFNPLVVNRWLWAVPLLSLLTALAGCPWRYWRRWALASGCAAVVAAAAVLLVFGFARNKPYPYGIRIAADRDRVMVNGSNPQVWIVDDGVTLGGAFASKELRSWFARNPDSQSVGYVRSCAYLPGRSFRRLVLGGAAGDEWLRYVSSSPEARKTLPREVVFLSPPFPPSAIPAPLHSCASVKYVTGEFNARYDREFDAPPAWVDIVPSMELYIAGWMRYAQ